MNFFLDTNVLVYSLHSQAPFYAEVNNFLSRCLSENITCYFLSSSLKDTYYILRKHYLPEANARYSIRMFRKVFEMIDLNSVIIDKVFSSNEPDFEDALVRSAAEVLQVDAIISYDKDAFKASFIPKLTAINAFE